MSMCLFCLVDLEMVDLQKNIQYLNLSNMQGPCKWALLFWDPGVFG